MYYLYIYLLFVSTNDLYVCFYKLFIVNFSYLLKSPDLNPIEMVWNELKRTVAREVPRTKQELQDCILRFWSTQMTAEKCAIYIDHVFKVVPVCILMRKYEFQSQTSPTPISNVSLKRYIQSYTPVVNILLAKEEINKEWDEMMEETAYQVLVLLNK